AERSEAFRQLLAVADKENSEAWFQLGNCFEHGWGTEPNVAKATDWYRRAVERKHAGAVVRLAHLKLQGDDAAAREAIDLLIVASNQGIGEASWILGWAHEYRVLEGERSTFHSKKPLVAKTWLLRLTDVDVPISRLGFARQWGMWNSRGPTVPEALAWYKKGELSGNSNSRVTLLFDRYEDQVQRYAEPAVMEEVNDIVDHAEPRIGGALASWYHYCSSIIQKPEFAESIWKKSLPGLEKLAETEDEEALKLLQFYHFRVREDSVSYESKIVSVIRRKAELGDPAAQYDLGWRYEHSTKDLNAAEKWYRLAAAQNIPAAQVALAILLEAKNTEQSIAEAKQLNESAREQQLIGPGE
ncbi:MAG: hypothetical protein K8U03_08735, partial [Planctomycetia bacterium]|nr:hypothetical protein [Planctomycetia bacterium]